VAQVINIFDLQTRTQDTENPVQSRYFAACYVQPQDWKLQEKSTVLQRMHLDCGVRHECWTMCGSASSQKLVLTHCSSGVCGRGRADIRMCGKRGTFMLQCSRLLYWRTKAEQNICISLQPHVMSRCTRLARSLRS